jgi:hypothetical protein
MALRMTRPESQLRWAGTWKGIFLMSIALWLEKEFARVNINDGMTEIMAGATGLMILFFVTQPIHWLNPLAYANAASFMKNILLHFGANSFCPYPCQFCSTICKEPGIQTLGLK